MARCSEQCEVYSRIVGYLRPVRDWNYGKVAEFHDRRTLDRGWDKVFSDRAGHPWDQERDEET